MVVDMVVYSLKGLLVFFYLLQSEKFEQDYRIRISLVSKVNKIRKVRKNVTTRPRAIEILAIRLTVNIFFRSSQYIFTIAWN